MNKAGQYEKYRGYLRYLSIMATILLLVSCGGGGSSDDGPDDNGPNPTTFYQDADGDGYGNASVSRSEASQPNGYVSNADDCNDGDATIHPGAPERADGLDHECTQA